MTNAELATELEKEAASLSRGIRYHGSYEDLISLLQAAAERLWNSAHILPREIRPPFQIEDGPVDPEPFI